MPLVFHQNMRVYGGGNATRNGAFAVAFGAINANMPGGQNYWVAGFTEVMNAGAPLRANLSGLAQLIDAGLTSFAVIEVGMTSVGATREYIAIAWNPALLNVQHVGQVLWNPVNHTWVGYNTGPGFLVNQTMYMPVGAPTGADTRGLAYVAGLDGGGAPRVFGFMHNMYNIGNKSAAYSSLGVMCLRMLIAMADVNYPQAGVNPTEFYLGGDFNLRPRNPTRRGAKVLYPKARKALGAGNAGPYVNTTNWHPYDYFVVSDNTLTDSRVRVHTVTRAANCSDHAGVTLRF